MISVPLRLRVRSLWLCDFISYFDDFDILVSLLHLILIFFWIVYIYNFIVLICNFYEMLFNKCF